MTDFSEKAGRRADDTQVRRIALLCTRLEGGIGRNTIRLTRHFASLGIAVEIWVGESESDFPGEVPGDVPVRIIASTHGVSGALFIYKLIQAFRPHVIVTPTERLTRIVWRASRFVGQKPVIVACVHNLYSKQYQHLSPAKAGKRKRHLAAVYPRLGAVIGVSRSVAEDFREYIGRSPDNISIIYNPVVDDDIRIDAGSTDLPLCYGKKPVIVTVGSIVPQKNHAFLIDCFARLRQTRDCALVIVGTGPGMEKIKTLVSQRGCTDDVYFVGHQPNPYAYIAKANVFAFTSDYEGFGNVVVESLVCGTPVVTTDSGGPAEIITDSECGEVVEIGDPDKFVAALDHWLDKRVDKDRLRLYAAEQFSTDKIAGQYLSLFNSLVARPGADR